VTGTALVWTATLALLLALVGLVRLTADPRHPEPAASLFTETMEPELPLHAAGPGPDVAFTR
jgi:hypothetical protein